MPLNKAPVSPPSAPNTINRSSSQTLKFAMPSRKLVNSPKENIFVESADPHRFSVFRTT